MGINRPMRQEGSQLGRYRLLRLLGRGGMGEVWLAEDSDLGRQVAIKLLPAVLASEKDYLDAFRYEARAAAALEHPHILPVHDFGEQRQEEGEITTYLVMPYITGGTLRDRLRAVGGPLPVEEAMDYLSQAALAIDYAHQHGVLHRDIKPANMLLQDGWLLLADFGIAKLLTTSTYRSRTHSGAGTPEYMAPEQSQKRAEPASDRYSLGIIAYQLFCGQLPFQADTPYGVLIKHIRGTPPAPRHFNPALPQAVEAVLLQGIARRPDERPASCAAFVTALQRAWKESTVEGQDPEATLLAPWSKYRSANLPTRHMTPGTAFPKQERETASPAWQQTLPQENEQVLDDTVNAPTSFPQTVEAPKRGVPWQESVYRRRTLLIGGVAATAALAGGGTLAALLHGRMSPQINQKGAVPSPIFTQPPGPHKLIPGVPLLSLNGHTETTHSAAWNPTSRYLATGGEDSRLMLWDIETTLANGTTSFRSVLTPQQSWSWNYLTGDHEFCWSADGQDIIVAEGIWLFNPFKHSDHRSQYDDLPTTFESTYGPAEYDSLAWQPGTDHFAASISIYHDPPLIAVEIWSRSRPQRPLTTLRYSGPIPGLLAAHSIAWSLDGNLLATYLALVSSDFKLAYPIDPNDPSHRSYVIIWHATSGQVRQVLSLPPPAHLRPVPPKTPLAWSPVDANLLAFGYWNNAIIWDIQRNAPLLTLSVSDAQQKPQPAAINVIGLAWSPDGRYLAGCYGASRKIYIWDIETLRRTASSPNTIQNQALSFPASSGAGHSLPVTGVSWSPNGRYIASTSSDKTVIVWQVDGS